jgi:DNA-binding LacI/PurR family transcriptional regulator
MSSIRDVAKLAGVSPATVSRVMNGTATVAEEKREKVLSAIAQTGFIPNETARTLFRKSAKTIGLVIPSIHNPYFTQLAAILDELSAEQGYRLFLCNVGTDPEKQRSTIQMLIAANTDGIILASEITDAKEVLENCSIPVVSVDTKPQAGCVRASVYCDYYQGARLAMEHLLECGCERIVCIKGPQRIFSGRRRYEAYRDICRERNLPERTVECDYDFDSGLAMTEQLLHLYPEVDGILACNDIVAISTYKILHKKNIAVPGQIQLTGFDDIDLAALMSPELTTVRQPLRAMAEKAMEVIIRQTDNAAAQTEYIFPPELIRRETTKRRVEQ